MNFSVFIINPLTMYKYAGTNIRPGKTDNLDSITIANYGIDNWFKMIEAQYRPSQHYCQLRLLSRQYNQYISMRVKSKLTLLNLLDRTMPQIGTLLENDSQNIKKDKLNSFVVKFVHYDNITKMSENRFVTAYTNWAKKEGYQASESKAKQIYNLASSSIPTLSSEDQSVKMLTLESVRMQRELCTSTDTILAQMIDIAKELKEFSILKRYKRNR